MKTAAHLKITPSLISTLFFVTLAHSANAETVRQQQSTVSGIQHVVIETPGDLEIRLGKEESLTIEAESKVLPYLEHTTQKDTLYLRSKGSFSTTHKIRYVLIIPSLQSLSMQGSSSVTLNAFQGNTLEIGMSSASRAVVQDIKVDHLILHVSSAGRINISGQSKKFTAKISGSGNVYAENLATENAEAIVSSAGYLRVNASKHLTAKVSGAGKVRYQGNPEINHLVSGAGSIKPL